MSLLQDPSQVAVQLLDSDDGNLVPIQEGMDLLRSMGRIDAAVVVIGPMRSGKSVCCVFFHFFLLNFEFFSVQCAFWPRRDI